MNPTFSAGTLPAWRHPIRLRRRIDDIDSLSGDYVCARSTTLTVGDAVPGYAGMTIIGLEETDSGISHQYSIEAEGSLNGLYESKLLDRSEVRTLGPTFETFVERRLSWHTGRKAITGTASTDTITCTAHGYADGQRVVLHGLTGGSGLTGQTSSVLGTVYYVRDAATNSFKLATTAGGSAVNFTSDISAGYVLAAEFSPGSVHPDWPSMYLVAVQLMDRNTGWRTADCQYAGLMWDKPYHRIITCNGQQFSSSEPIAVDLTGGWTDPLYSTFHLPEIVLTDTFVSTATLATSSVPSIATPTNAPTIQSLSLDGDDDLFTWNYPYGWSFMEVSDVETLNAQISIKIHRASYRYIWPKSFK